MCDSIEAKSPYTYEYILTQTPNATRNVADFYRKKFFRQSQSKMVNKHFKTISYFLQIRDH